MDSITYLVKYILMAANLVIAFGAILLLSIGAVKYFDIRAVMEHIGREITPLFIVLGVLIFVVALIGFCGACMEHYCLTITYGVLLTIAVLIQVAIIIATFVIIPHSNEHVSKGLEYLFNNTFKANGTFPEDLFDGLQKYMQCCGTFNYTSYFELEDYRKGLPKSCCLPENVINSSSTNNTCLIQAAYKEGCNSALLNFMNRNGYTLAGLGIGFTIADSIGALFAYSFAKTIRDEY